MKKTALFLALIALLAACHDKVINKYMACVPVYTDYETFRQPAQFGPAKSITSNGFLYMKDQYLFVVQPEAGIHFIDNTNPALPANIGFLNLQGCTGMAIRDNYLYANSFIDLVVFDISFITAPVEINRQEDFFPQALPLIEKNYPIAEIDKSKGVVTSWIYEERKEEVDNSQIAWNNCPNCDIALTSASFESSSSPVATAGISGSYSRFTIIGDYLYIMDFNQLKPVNIANPAALTTYSPVGVWADVETLFPHNGYIFMGTTTGMMIYGTVNPEMPNYVSSVTHMRGCDPVVVQDNYCYVTIRSNGDCGGDLNQLDVIDITDINAPALKNSFQMDQPQGVGIDGSLLFICDGESGLKIFDATNPLTCGNNLLKHFTDIHATDVIPYNNIAIVIGDDGIRQYDYSDLNNLVLLSSINY
jgi:hypothetical protein